MNEILTDEMRDVQYRSSYANTQRLRASRNLRLPATILCTGTTLVIWSLTMALSSSMSPNQAFWTTSKLAMVPSPHKPIE